MATMTPVCPDRKRTARVVLATWTIVSAVVVTAVATGTVTWPVLIVLIGPYVTWSDTAFPSALRRNR